MPGSVLWAMARHGYWLPTSSCCLLPDFLTLTAPPGTPSLSSHSPPINPQEREGRRHAREGDLFSTRLPFCYFFTAFLPNLTTIRLLFPAIRDYFAPLPTIIPFSPYLRVLLFAVWRCRYATALVPPFEPRTVFACPRRSSTAV